ncbi:MAG: DUF2922 domain-containing protein [Synergistaceae bacterium]|jgi:hypothetical protein|nr:DUF2922 domain-containing protein [Synergistaceae bacterium]
MADLRLTFDGGQGKKLAMTFSNANPATPAGSVKALIAKILANKEIFSEEPGNILNADFVTTTVTPVNLS